MTTFLSPSCLALKRRLALVPAARVRTCKASGREGKLLGDWNGAYVCVCACGWMGGSLLPFGHNAVEKDV